MKRILMLLLFTLSLLAVPACNTWHRTSSGRLWAHPSSEHCSACPARANAPEIRPFNTCTAAKRLRHRIQLWLDNMTISADDPDRTIGDKNFTALKKYLQGEPVAVWMLIATADELSDAIKDLGLGQAYPEIGIHRSEEDAIEFVADAKYIADNEELQEILEECVQNNEKRPKLRAHLTSLGYDSSLSITMWITTNAVSEARLRAAIAAGGCK